MEEKIPEGFRERVLAEMVSEGERLLAALDEPPATSIKLNRRKTGDVLSQGIGAVEELLGYQGLEPVEWCRSGFYLPERPQFTLNPLLHAGVFYVQEAASMVYESIIRQHAAEFQPGYVLDLCAAPGGKSTSILNALPDGWKLVANEFNPQRAGALRENLLKWGYPDITVTNADTSRFAIAPLFSIVAVDAPCSGEGMMRKEPVARTQWSPGLVASCAALQREILANALDALLPGGLLIYSTCTFNSTENDDNARWLADTFGLEPLMEPQRFIPGTTRGEGFFVAAFRKPGHLTVPAKGEKVLARILKGCRLIVSGIPDEIAPLRTDFKAGEYPEAELDEATALNYLRHQAITLPADAPRGITVVKYRGIPLGFVKNLGNRANNMYPKEWRIRNL